MYDMSTTAEQETCSLEPYTKADVESMLEEGVRQATAGFSQDSDEMFRELKDKFAREDIFLK